MCWQGKADFAQEISLVGCWQELRQLKVSPRTSPQLSAPFPNDHIVVVDDENSFEQVRF